jgi:hypothetical protein
MHSICATVNGQPGKRTVTVDKAACERLQADLQEHLRASAAGEKARPMVMFDHAAGSAAAKPLEFVWDDQRGILLRVEWTKAGKEAVEGGNYGYISPSFRLEQGTGTIRGLAPGIEVGSLVNDPAFEKNECIAASMRTEPLQPDEEWVSGTFLPPLDSFENSDSAGDNKAVAGDGGVNNKRKKDMEEINKLLGLAPDADASAVYSAIAALKKQDRDAIKYTRLAYGTGGLLLLLPFIAIFLTGARDIPQFNLADWIIFSILCFLEISTMIAMFTFAIKTRRSTPIDLDKQIYAIRRTTVETAPLPKTAWKLKAVLTDAYFCERITVYEGCMENNSTSCCFRVEMFEDDFQLKFAFESEFFENCADLNLLQNHLNITKNFT